MERPEYGENTRAVHTPPPPTFAQTPLGLPVYRTAAFAFGSMGEFAEVLADPSQGYSYSRVDNPTSDTFAAGVAALEGAGVDGEVTGQPFASGMAAISTTALTFLSAGDHVVADSSIYGGTWSLLAHLLPRFDIRTTFVDGGDPAAVRAAMEPNTKVVWAETMTNPTLRVVDLRALAAAAHEAGALLCVDSTFATPALCRPLEHGVDVVVHSATKYLGGHSDVIGGVAVGRPELLQAIRDTRVELGGSLSPDDAFLLHRGLATLPLRMDRHCATARILADALAGHPAVERLRYPGRTDHPDHDVAAARFDKDRRGGLVTLDPVGGRDGGVALCDRLRVGASASSLAGTHTKVSHVPSTTHRQLDEAALATAGISPATVRVSVGLEDPEDLVTDFLRALDSLDA